MRHCVPLRLCYDVEVREIGHSFAKHSGGRVAGDGGGHGGRRVQICLGRGVVSGDGADSLD